MSTVGLPLRRGRAVAVGGGTRPQPDPDPCPVRVLVVHGQSILRGALIDLLDSADGFEVVGEAATCAECCQQLAALAPDVLICHLPPNQACNLLNVRCLSGVNATIPVVVLCGDDGQQQIPPLARLGIRAFLTRDAPREALFDALRAVRDGGYFLDRRAQSVLMQAMGADHAGALAGASELSPREHRVLELIAQGKTNSQIASKLHVSRSTAKHTVSSLLVKLGASNRACAVRIAIDRGLIPH